MALYFRKRNERITHSNFLAHSESEDIPKGKHRVSDIELFQKMGIHIQHEGTA